MHWDINDIYVQPLDVVLRYRHALWISDATFHTYLARWEAVGDTLAEAQTILNNTATAPDAHE